MPEYFPEVSAPITYEGPKSQKTLAFKHYNPKKRILGKTMAEHLRFAVCYWHTFKGAGGDPFGPGTMLRKYNEPSGPMAQAEATMHAAFEFFTKLGVGFWCFHDHDIAPEGATLAESHKNIETIAALAKNPAADRRLALWHEQFFAHRRFWPEPRRILREVMLCREQGEEGPEVTKELAAPGMCSGAAGSRDTLLNTNMKRELDHLGRFQPQAVEQEKIGFKGQFYIEPAREPTKHQYDFDAASCHAFLQKYPAPVQLLSRPTRHARGPHVHPRTRMAAVSSILGSVDASRDVCCSTGYG